MNKKARSAQEIIALICQEPYRLFFPLGVLIGVFGVGHWWFYAAGWSPSYSGISHALIQIQGYMTCFIFGFLMTAMPRFSSTPHATGKEVLVISLLICSVTGLLTARFWIAAEISYICLLAAFARFALVRILKRDKKSSPPVEFVWIPIALLHGIIGASIFILFLFGVIPAWFRDIGEDMVTQGFVLAIVAGVGGFLAPRLMGLFQAPKVQGSDCCSIKKANEEKKRRVLVHLALGMLLFLSFWLETETMEYVSHGLRALVVTGVFFLTRSLPRFPRSQSFFSRLLWVSLWMVVLGLWLTVFFPAYEKTTLHVTFLGGFNLMTFAVATMVVLSHGGEAERLQRPLFIFQLIALGIALALTFRVAAVFYPEVYFKLLAIAAIAWIFMGVSWLCFAAPRLIKIPEIGAFERQHEEMKQRIQAC
jgi:uncharacterized protein involved in response to NO